MNKRMLIADVEGFVDRHLVKTLKNNKTIITYIKLF